MTVGFGTNLTKTVTRQRPTGTVLSTAIAYWKASTYSGSGDLLDGSGNGHDLAITGAAFADGAFTFVAAESDYMELADHADLDFNATDDFTVAISMSVAGAPAGRAVYMAKRNAAGGTTAVGWYMECTAASLVGRLSICDGAARPEATKSTITAGLKTLLAGVRSVGVDSTFAYLGSSSGAATTDTTTLTLENAEVFRIGRLSGAGTSYADLTFYGAAIFRRALNGSELGRLAIELGGV